MQKLKLAEQEGVCFRIQQERKTLAQDGGTWNAPTLVHAARQARWIMDCLGMPSVNPLGTEATAKVSQGCVGNLGHSESLLPWILAWTRHSCKLASFASVGRISLALRVWNQSHSANG